jgi:sulfofructose kinase
VIICCGYLNLDISVRLPVLPTDGSRVQATAIERQPGGMAANVASAAARFGAPVGFVGAVGDDADGRYLVEDLAAQHIGVEDVVRDRATTLCLILVTPDGQRAILSEDDQVTQADVRAAHTRAVASEGILYLDGYRWPEAADTIAGEPRRATVVTDLDGCVGAVGLDAAMRCADHVLCSQSYFAELTASDKPRDTALHLAGQHDTTVVLTDGAKGWWATANGRQSTAAGFEVAVVDTTGAGDAFCGAYLAEIHRGKAVHVAAGRANAAAALSTRALGARAGLVDRAAAIELLRTTS